MTGHEHMRRLAVALALALAIVGRGCEESKAPVTPDLEAPAVLTVYPADGAVGVAVGATASVRFSEPVVIDTLGAEALRIEGPAGTVDGEVALDSTATVLTLTPFEELVFGAEYELILAAGIADGAGNVLPDSLTARFTTGLAFHDIGRIFIANEISRDLTVLDLEYQEIEGSPIALNVYPVRMCGAPESGRLYLLYREVASAGVLVLDARTLTWIADSGPILPGGVIDLTVVSDLDLLLAVSPPDNAMFTLSAASLDTTRPRLVFPRAESDPVTVAVSRRFGWALVGLDGGGRLDAYELPALTQVAGFPVEAVNDIHTIAVDEERARAWVGGAERYAVVDLINTARTTDFQIPITSCWQCTPRLWKLLFSPCFDRVYLMNRREGLAAVVLSTVEPALEGPGRVGWGRYMTDIVQNPRTGDLVVLGWSNTDTRTYLVDPSTLRRRYEPMPNAGDKAIDMELMP